MASYITDGYGKMPVEYHSNVHFVGNQTDINNHVQDILKPLMPYIRNKRTAPAVPPTLFNSLAVTISDAEDAGPVPYPPAKSSSGSWDGGSSSSSGSGLFNGASDQSNIGSGTVGTDPNALNQVVHLFEYKYDLVTSATIGPFTFS